MKYLVIYGHPYDQSFNHAVKDTLIEQLKSQGQEVRVRDLYALNFDPVLKASELEGFKNRVYPQDIKAEQEHIAWADVLIFISPIWWGGLTAIMRGYCDRVFSLNFAYEETEQGPRGLLQGKGGYFINTIGAPLEVYEKMGVIRSMKQTIGEIILDFCAMTNRGHTFFGAIKMKNEQERQDMLAEVRSIADGLLRPGTRE